MTSRPTRVLVVDDERYIARLLEFILDRAGYEVVVCYDGESALVKVREFAPDVVLLDLLLPKMSGDEVLRHIRSDPHLAKMVVVVLTARSFDESPEGFKESGADSHCTKPIAPSTLMKTLEDLGRPPRWIDPDPTLP